jgi:hypothetical protein
MDRDWKRYVVEWERRSDATCLAEQVIRDIVMRRGLPPNTYVPVSVVCRCPRCTPHSLAGGPLNLSAVGTHG